MSTSPLPRRPFGRTGLEVPVLGFGAGSIGGAELSEGEAERLLKTVVDEGLTLVDTAPSYGLSEERIGRHLASRRAEIVLSTKVGYGVHGVPDWTWEAVARGVDGALGRLRTDVLDVVHLHSCSRELLERGEVVDALEAAVAAGKVRVAAYSGENEALELAVAGGRFGAVQTSVNPFDQNGLDGLLPRAREAGLGVLAKRPLGNAAWRWDSEPEAPDVAEYHRRFRRLMEIGGLEPEGPGGIPWPEAALRFAAHAPGVDAVLVGSTDPAHLRANRTAVEKGPLPPEVEQRLRQAWRATAEGWAGVI